MNRPDAPLDPMTSFVAGNRRAFGGLLVVLGLAIGLLGGYACAQGYRFAQSTESKTEDAEKAKPADAPANAGKPTEWYLGGATGIVAGIVLIPFGFMSLMALPKPTAENHADARMTILLVGTAVGLLLILLGGALFALRLDALNDWLSLGKAKAMLPVVSAVAVGLVGVLIAFLAILPARAEERNDPTIRRLVYGSNAVLSSLVLLGALVGLNAFVAVKLPVALDTTSSGFYTLDPKTVGYLENLDQPVTLVTTFGSDSSSREIGDILGDIQRLLKSFAETNPLKVQVRTLSPVADATEINALAARHPSFPIKNDYGVLVQLGSDSNRAAYVGLRDFFNETNRGERIFEGEGRLIRELLFLADNKAKTVVYVTQGSGELALVPKRGERGFSLIAEKLGLINCDVKPLVVDPKQPRVPADANLVIVPDPVTPLPKATADAIGDYLLPATPNTKRGKFLILAGPNPAPDNKALVPTGLESPLKSLGVELGREQLFSDPDTNGVTFMPVAVPAAESTSPIAREYTGMAIRFFPARGVAPITTGNPESRVEPLFTTKPGTRTYIDDPDLRGASLFTWQEMQKNPDLARAKKYSSDARPVGVTVGQGKTTQGIVLGTGLLFSDQVLRQAGGKPVELIASCVDALRERPTVASLATKQYGVYKPPPVENFSRAFWLPVLLTPLAIAAIGVGVWVVRRR
jgi:hypothetical protein